MKDFQIKEELDKNGKVTCYTVKINMGGYFEKRRFDSKEKLIKYLSEVMEDESFKIKLDDSLFE